MIIITGLKDGVPVRERKRRGDLLSIADLAVACRCSVGRVETRMKQGLLPERERVGQLLYWRREQMDELQAVVMGPTKWTRKADTNRKLDSDQERELVRLRASGLTQQELGVRFGISQGHVSRVLKRLRNKA